LRVTLRDKSGRVSPPMPVIIEEAVPDGILYVVSPDRPLRQAAFPAKHPYDWVPGHAGTVEDARGGGGLMADLRPKNIRCSIVLRPEDIAASLVPGAFKRWLEREHGQGVKRIRDLKLERAKSKREEAPSHAQT